MKEIGVYIHIPFCKRKCLYCDFVSFSKNEDIQKQYIEALKKEINNWKQEKRPINTVYIGGGTPSYIDSKYIVDILQNLLEEKNISITIEVNPGTVTKQKLEDYKKAGINRLSIGLQSTNNILLKELGRIHNYEDFLETYTLAREVGFENINVDLMIGLPKQKVSDIKEDLNKIIELKPEHLSVYSLIIEDETPFAKLIQS